MNIKTFDGWALIDVTTGWPVEHGSKHCLSNGLLVTVVGGREPQHDASTGRVYVSLVDDKTSMREYFPNVLNMKWVNTNNERNHLQLTSEYTLGGIFRMKEAGGGFASALALAYLRADMSNRARIMDAFDDLIGRHARDAAELAATEEQS